MEQSTERYFRNYDGNNNSKIQNMLQRNRISLVLLGIHIALYWAALHPVNIHVIGSKASHWNWFDLVLVLGQTWVWFYIKSDV